MSWFVDIAGKAESLLNNLDKQTGAAIRNHNISKQRKHDKNDYAVHPEPSWSQKKRPIPRTLKKITPVTECRSNYAPIRKDSPTHHLSRSPVKSSQDNVKNGFPKPKKSISRKLSPQYTLDRSPKTLVGDLKDNEINMDQPNFKQRRHSLPVDLEIVNNEEWTYRMQNLEVENAMLKNELNVMNREVSELLDSLRKTEDGNNVVNGYTEVNKTHNKLESSKLQNHKLNVDNEALTSQLELLKQKVHDMTTMEMTKYKEQNHSLETEVCLLRDRNKDVEDRLKELTEKSYEKDSHRTKLENDLRHAQATIEDLHNNLEKTTAECQRLEKDWETYKIRVKSMLHSKDNEIKSLQDGFNFSEDTKILMEQLEALKDEREELSEVVSGVRGECSEVKQCVERLEARREAAERAAAALRDALRDERAARTRADTHSAALGKELKSVQLETGQTIASLRTALRDKENELSHMRESTTSVRSTDTSALNVADYDVIQDDINHEKIHCLTQTLVQKQGKIESLLADNNMLRIQLDKLQIGLHFWVLTVLFTSTPEDYVTSPAKS